MGHSAALGTAAVLGGIFAFGTFGVPIKSRRLLDAQVHPLVVQSYKTAVCFVTCWLTLLVVPLRFTWWGTLGALIWVLNGIAAIVAIQAAGLAVAQALWSGLSVLVAFLWGVAVFHERVQCMPLAVAGLLLMSVGMAAIGVVSGWAASAAAAASAHSSGLEANGDFSSEMQRLVDSAASSSATGSASEAVPGGDPLRRGPLPEAPGPPAAVSAASTASASAPTVGQGAVVICDGGPEALKQQHWRPSYSFGVACAVYVGIANGSFLVPLKYANQEVTGLEYLISFGIGAALVTSSAVTTYMLIAPRLGWRALRLEWRAAAAPAGLAGVLWSAGNVFSIVAAEHLGLALAWPAIQAQLLVSTVWVLESALSFAPAAWGALYYKEAAGVETFSALLAATAAVVCGVAALAAARG